MARSTLRVWLRSTRDRSGVCQAHTGPRVIHGERGGCTASAGHGRGSGWRRRAFARKCVYAGAARQRSVSPRPHARAQASMPSRPSSAPSHSDRARAEKSEQSTSRAAFYMYTIPPRGLKACICIIGGLELRSHLHADASAPSAVSFASTINLATRTMRTTRGSATSEASMVAEGHRAGGRQGTRGCTWLQSSRGSRCAACQATRAATAKGAIAPSPICAKRAQ